MDQKINIIDGDGHVFEDLPAIVRRMPGQLRESAFVRLLGPFPQLDHLHHGAWVSLEGSFQDPGVAGWRAFLDRAGFSAAVMYPTIALAYGRLTDPDLAIGACQAYNDWIAEDYLATDPRLNAMALIPMQDPAAAAAELERAVDKLGLKGAMLPPTGLPLLLGAQEYARVYEVADALGCALAVHGGAHPDLGLNHQQVFAGTHALGHPFAITIQAVDLILHGVFDRYPRVRFGFMEGGLAWLLLLMERLPGSFSAFTPYDPTGRYIKAANGGEVRQRIRDYIDSGQLFVGVEGDEGALAFGIAEYGAGPFVFSSDFPHEVNDASIQHEIDELLANPMISVADKAAILGGNAARFYGLN
jgi:uncharacterized protein